MTTKQAFTVLTGESYTVYATSADEALAKFYVSQGYVEETDYDGEPFDFTDLDNDVEESETLTEVIS
jgi:hypothetical protein